MKRESLAYSLVTTLLRVAVLVALITAVWSIYRTLPKGSLASANNGAGETALQIILRPAAKDESAAVNIPVELYPVDLVAVQREFGFEPHPGVHFEDFLKERMKGREPVKGQLDERGQATLMVMPGKWWLYAVLSEARNAEWRLPVNISGRQQIIELNSGNMYTRTGSY